MPCIYEMIGILRAILAHNLAKYQYNSIRPSLFDKYYKIANALQFSTLNILKRGFYGQKITKMAISH